MPRRTKDQRLAEIHRLALEQFEESFNATREDRERARMARRFVNIRGAQWDWDEAGQFSNRMKLEIDHVAPAVIKIKNEFRKNRIAAVFNPKDGIEADALSDACAGRFRADTMDQRGRDARAMAFDCAVEGGFGGIRLRAEYESDKRQRVCLEAINDPEATLFFDVNAKNKDKSDAEHAFLLTPWSRRAFERKYGQEAANWPDMLAGQFKYGWFTTDTVIVAEYFVREDKTDKYRVFKGYGDEKEEFLEDEVTDEDIDRLTATGFAEVEGREEEIKRVVKYVMSGAKILSGPEELAGTEIPLVPQYGHRTVIDGVERFRGHVLKLVDSQIVYNLQVSKVGETAAAAGIEKPIFLPQQIQAHAELWQNDHIDNNAYLTVDPLIGPNGETIAQGPVGFTKSPDVPQSVAELIALTKADIAEQLGNQQNAETAEPDTSGVALELVQNRIDMQTYGYLENAGEAERRLAEVWLGIASVVYVENGRKLRTLDDDGKPGQVELGRKTMTKDGEVVDEVDFSRARFDIDFDIGPTSSSRRASIVRTVTGLMGQSDPETAVMLGHVALMNMEGEGLSDVREFSRKRLVAMGVIKPTKEELSLIHI